MDAQNSNAHDKTNGTIQSHAPTVLKLYIFSRVSGVHRFNCYKQQLKEGNKSVDSLKRLVLVNEVQREYNRIYRQICVQ
jgi:hypothetical protein